MTKNELLHTVFNEVSENPDYFRDVVDIAAQARESLSAKQEEKVGDYYTAMVNALALVSEKRLNKRLKDYLNDSLVEFFKKSDRHCKLVKDFVVKVEKEND